ncbi:MAG: PAS domain-containing sensor histidine kinase [Planctomycetes bacterium]|nr:PAS domain-containing sensor histidine kinase [Planctomycetota bacterium]
MQYNKLKYEQSLFMRALMVGGVGTVVSSYFIIRSGYEVRTQIFLMVLVIFSWLGFAYSLKTRAVFSLRTMANLLEGVREGDFSMRMKGAGRDDAMGELVWEVNAISEMLKTQRLNAVEATVLLRKVMAEIDVAMFGFDEEQRLQLVNESGKRLLGRSEEELLGCHASQLHLADCLGGDSPRIVDMTFSGGFGRWQLRRNSYREGGLSHQLLFLTDLTQALHEEERQAWQRVVRILRHEINNSLAPIQSVAASLGKMVKRQGDFEGFQEDLEDGLEIIAERSDSLSGFIGAYSKLTQLPKPCRREMDVETWVRRVASLEPRMEVTVEAGPAVSIQADQGQLEQLLINLVSNAVESCMEAQLNGDGQAQISWILEGEQLLVRVDDNGCGLQEAKNVFVPFYTTKPEGSGIGLALSRQIAEVHGGSLSLANHQQESGCRACLILPVKGARENPKTTPGPFKDLITVSKVFDIGRKDSETEQPKRLPDSRKAS